MQQLIPNTGYPTPLSHSLCMIFRASFHPFWVGVCRCVQADPSSASYGTTCIDARHFQASRRPVCEQGIAARCQAPARRAAGHTSPGAINWPEVIYTQPASGAGHSFDIFICRLHMCLESFSVIKGGERTSSACFCHAVGNSWCHPTSLLKKSILKWSTCVKRHQRFISQIY